MVLVRPISNSSSLLTKLLGTVLRVPIRNGIMVTFVLHSFFSPLGRSKYLTLFSVSLTFTLWASETAKSSIWKVLLFLLSQCLFALVCYFAYYMIVSSVLPHNLYELF